MVDFEVSSMKAYIWHMLLCVFTFLFYNFYLDYVKVVTTLQCLNMCYCIYMVATVHCYLGICKPSCHGTAKPCCLGIDQYCCLGTFQSGYLGIYQPNCLGIDQPSSQDENIQLGCPEEGLFGFAAQNEDFLAWLPIKRGFQLCCPMRGLFSLVSLMWTIQLGLPRRGRYSFARLVQRSVPSSETQLSCCWDCYSWICQLPREVFVFLHLQNLSLI